jgi:hypothetical protein
MNGGLTGKAWHGKSRPSWHDKASLLGWAADGLQLYYFSLRCDFDWDGSQGQASPLLLTQERFAQDATTKYQGRVVGGRGRMDGWTIGAAHLEGEGRLGSSLLPHCSHRSGTQDQHSGVPDDDKFCRVSLGASRCADGVVCLSLHRCWISMARCREATRSSYPCRRRHEDARARGAWERGAWDKAALFSESSEGGAECSRGVWVGQSGPGCQACSCSGWVF